MQPDYDEIIPNLFLGNILSTQDKNFLYRDNIKYVLSLTKNEVYLDPKIFKHIQFNVNDAPYEDLISLFDICHSFIMEGLQRRVGVLVHCDMGISRSSTIVMSFLMRVMNKPFSEVFRYVKLRRPKVNPNFGFQAQLLLFGKMNCTRTGSNPYHKLYKKFLLRDNTTDEIKFDVRGYLTHISDIGDYKPPVAYTPKCPYSYAKIK